MPEKPNIVIIMTDQHRADVCAREGFPLDTTPFLDSLARGGAWFRRAYTTNPTCAPARVSLMTGRYPSAHRTRCNHNLQDAHYGQDLVDVLKARGYATAVVGKNHSHLTPERVDHWFGLGHGGGSGPDRSDQEKAFDEYLRGLRHRADLSPTSFPVECQGPYRAVTDAQKWLGAVQGQPFFLWLTFAEPHNPYQAPEPYWSMFPVDQLPPTRTGKDVLPTKGYKWEFTRRLGERAFPDYAAQLTRARASYFGMLRLIDDQVKRFVEFLDKEGLRENTLIVFVSDHGDFVGEYGLVRKGPEMPELLMRIPMLFQGPGIVAGAAPREEFVSLADVMPTLCEAVGAPLPPGVQGRSLWPMLAGGEFPREEFAVAYGEHGFGGLHYTAEDDLDPAEEGALNDGCSFDCLNSWSQSGTMRMLRKGKWKLVFDMQGHGQLYDLDADPLELNNLYCQPDLAEVRQDLLAELLAAALRAQDPLPLPRNRYVYKSDPRNYWAPYR